MEMQHKILSRSSASLFIMTLACTTLLANTAIQPVPKGEKWMKRHEAMVERANQGDIDLLLLGNSITDYWNKRAKDVYQDTFGDYKTANFGISADRTQHLLWRLQNGIGEGFQPEVTVLLIGTNNTGWEKNKEPRNQPDEVITGIKTVVNEVTKRFPESKLLLFALFPRGDADNPQRDQIDTINKAIASLHDGDQIFFYDIGHKFLDENGEIPESLMPDKLHPSAEGYKIWSQALQKPLKKFLSN